MPAFRPEGRNVCQPEKRKEIANDTHSRGATKKKRRKLFDFTFLFVCPWILLSIAAKASPNFPQNQLPSQKLLLQAHFHCQTKGGKAGKSSQIGAEKMFRIHFRWKLIFSLPSRRACQLNSLRFICFTHFVCIFSGIHFIFFFKNLTLEQRRWRGVKVKWNFSGGLAIICQRLFHFWQVISEEK